jgi:VanZ family protein
MVLIFTFSSQSHLPGPDNDWLDILVKKTAHLFAYGVLALCYLFALGDWRKRPWALLLATLYAFSDEYHQSWTPLRTPSLTDVLIDLTGAAIALWGIALRLDGLLQKQFKVRLAVTSKQVAKRSPKPLDRFVAKPKAD